MTAPHSCPMCGNIDKWRMDGSSSNGFSFRKAAIGGAVLGAAGLTAGFLGNKKVSYRCGNCGYKHEY